jgi:hypothetical protein
MGVVMQVGPADADGMQFDAYIVGAKMLVPFDGKIA